MSGAAIDIPAGPWSFHIGHDYTEFFDARGNSIFTVFYAMPEPTARLIAAAPSLLAAGEAICTDLGACGKTRLRGGFMAIRDAVADVKCGDS